MGNNQFARMLKYYLMLNQKTQSDLVKDLGYEKSTVSNWCAGIRVPKLDVIIDIADYLHVNAGDLIEDNRNSGYYIDPDVAEIANTIKERPEMKVLFDASKNISKEDINMVLGMIEVIKNREK
ncbi:MAG: helix-turn-helix transcriptional regulator [Eubacteriaceae bacterium]|nr:helix-turn-helix transcriptional regulator [Eubacteriaceae bacterium]